MAYSLLEMRIVINGTISDAKHGARFMCLNRKDFFLATPMPNPECMRVPYKYFPEDICLKYNLQQKAHKDSIYIKIKLAQFGYEPIPLTLSYWCHKINPTKFCLCVDDFGLKYYNKANFNRPISALQQNYTISKDF